MLSVRFRRRISRTAGIAGGGWNAMTNVVDWFCWHRSHKKRVVNVDEVLISYRGCT